MQATITAPSEQDWKELLKRVAASPDPLEVVRADQASRWRAGNCLPVEEYLDRFKDLSSDDMLRLILAEIGLRRDRGESVTPAEFQERFPRHHEALANHLAAMTQQAATTARLENITRDELSRTGEYVESSNPFPQIPGYHCEAEVGRGGMGIVLLARDRKLDREVAIKIMHGHTADEARRRFVRESKITASLPHPGVPPVYAIGELPDGSPFLVMKLIRGKTLGERLRERSPPSSDLPNHVQMFEQIAQTIAYVHSRGVIHRDLKPANIMVGAFGEVQVMDWGLAKENGVFGEEFPATFHSESRGQCDDVAATQAGQILGTPAYMAPEQARGATEQVSFAADVFALGGILCEILTGQPPFSGRSRAEVIQRAAHGDVGVALARLADCGADAELVAIAVRCLQAAPVDRFTNGAEVAQAIAAYRSAVEDRIRTAEQEKAAAEARTGEQRKKRLVQLALAASIGLLVIGTLVFAWWRDKQRSDRTAEEARVTGEREGERRAYAVERRIKADQTHAAVQANLGQAVALRKRYRFPEARAILRTSRQLAESDAPELIPVVERAQLAFELVVALDETRLKRSTLKIAPGGATGISHATTSRDYKTVFSHYGFDISDDSRLLSDRIRASPILRELVDALDDWSTLEEDVSLMRKLLEVARLVEPGSWSDRLRDPKLREDKEALQRLAKEALTESDISASAIIALATLMWEQGLDAISVLVAAQARHRDDFLLAFTLAFWHQDLKDDDKRALEYYRVALAIRPDSITVLLNLSVIQSEAGHFDEAIVASREVIRIAPGLSEGHHSLAAVFIDKGDYAAAEAPLRETIRLDPEDALAHSNLGIVLLNRDDVSDAVKMFEKSVKLDPNSAVGWYNLGNARRRQLNWPAAIAGYREAIRLNPQFTDAFFNLGLALGETGDRAGAEKALRSALHLNPERPAVRIELGSIIALRASPEDIEFLKETAEKLEKSPVAQNDLGLAYLTAGKAREALPNFDRAIALDNKATYHVNRSAALRKLERLDDAEVSVREAIRLDPDHSKAHNELGVLLFSTKRFDEALVEFATSIRLDSRYAQAYFNAGNVRMQKKEHAEAVSAFAKAVELDPSKATWQKMLGFARWNAGDPAGAAKAYAEAVRLEPGDAMAQFNLGFNLYQSGKQLESIDPLRRAIELKPDHSQAHCWLGAALTSQGDVDAALKAFGEAARHGLKTSYFHNLHGEALLRKNRLDDAETAFREALRLQPNHAAARKNLEVVLNRKSAGSTEMGPPPREVKR